MSKIITAVIGTEMMSQATVIVNVVCTVQ